MWEGRSLGRVVLRAVIFIRVFLSVVGLDGMGGGTRIGGEGPYKGIEPPWKRFPQTVWLGCCCTERCPGAGASSKLGCLGCCCMMCHSLAEALGRSSFRVGV